MILIVCTDSANCGATYRILGDVEELFRLVGPDSAYWPDKYKCPACACKALGVVEADLEPASLAGRVICTLEPQECFLALEGMGLPEERDCRRDVVEGLLREHPIRRVAGHEVSGANRFVLEWFELWDGTKIYFGASAHGAIISRITRPKNHTVDVLKEMSDGT